MICVLALTLTTAGCPSKPPMPSPGTVIDVPPLLPPLPGGEERCRAACRRGRELRCSYATEKCEEVCVNMESAGNDFKTSCLTNAKTCEECR